MVTTCDNGLNDYETDKNDGAEEGSRTPTPITGLDPEPSVSANSTTSAIFLSS